MKKIGKIVLRGGCLMTIICIALMLICNQIVTPCLAPCDRYFILGAGTVSSTSLLND